MIVSWQHIKISSSSAAKKKKKTKLKTGLRFNLKIPDPQKRLNLNPRETATPRTRFWLGKDDNFKTWCGNIHYF